MSGDKEIEKNDMDPAAPEPGQKQQIEDAQKEAAKEREEEGGYQ